MQIDGSTPIPLVIYGVPFHNVTFEEAVDWIVDRVRSGRPANIATANLDFVTQAWHDPELQRILIDADLVLADGFPVVKLSPFFGPELKGRVTGSDLTPMLAERAAKEGMSIYGLGGAAGVAEKALELLKERHPNLKIAGTYSPPFAELLEMDHREILQELEKTKPDILFVAFGAPKQDKFISMHVRGWNVPVAMGVGASLDFITGDQKRAPELMQKCCMEGLWRICCNPRRLFARYLANVRFLFSASRQMVQIHKMRDIPTSFQSLEPADLQTLEECGVAVERFQPLENEAAAAEFVKRIDGFAQGKNLLLDVHAAPWLNSLELGALLEVNKFCRQWGKRLILYAPRPKVRRLLGTCRLSDYFDTATMLDEVKHIAENLTEHVAGATAFDEGALKLELPIELTAATLPSFERDAAVVHHELKGKGALKTVEVDAAQLDFIDSAGLGFLIALKKTTQDEGVSMSIVNLDSRPRRTFEIARVDRILLHA
ncbi:WecB/TagA/CpsF family glycosyltransferase [Pontiellaceae bacterium B12227]|nr:WecB/TagA/CpsF family glycosyltransferase [Pontiellaceae bacterium B12227]